ncbi:signal peptidase I [Paenibacillus sp. MBLB4367]|uniref:signal peptidase I n=1 Tax=Paenibacillus sp. MBLB4367 TaxID=3384767 RepID=UPI003907E7C4
MKKLLREVWSWSSSIAVAVIISLLISTFVVQPTKVLGHSMDPTLQDNKRIFVSKLTHTFAFEADYSDIVIIDSRVDRKRTFKDDLLENGLLSLISGKEDDHIYFVKRVIGKPGDTIVIKNHSVYRNGELLEEPYVKEQMNTAGEKTYVVPEDHIFVMGDNRNHSTDSREIGFVPFDHVLGKKM